MVTVLKIGGSLLSLGPIDHILQDFKKAVQNERIILVHGGGNEVTKIAEKLGKTQRFIFSPSGIRSRYTDKETVEIYAMVMAGKINTEIVPQLQNIGVPAFGLSGVDGGLIRAERKKKLIIIDERRRKRFIEGGYTGKIREVNTEILDMLLKKDLVPVVSPIAIGLEGEILNVDGDRAAAYIAGFIKADNIIFLTDVEGIYIDGKLVTHLTLENAKTLMRKVGPGMDKKLMASIEAIEMGAKRGIISSGRREDPITYSLYGETRTVIGT